MTRGVDLTEEQQSRIKELVENQRSAVRESQTSLRAAITDLLTDEQKDKIVEAAVAGRMVRDRSTAGRAATSRRRLMMQRGRTASVAGGRYSAVARRLDLTAEQREQLSAILADGQNADASWRAANPDATRYERQKYAGERREATKTAIRGILTESQAAKFEELERRSTDRTRPTRLRRGTRR